MKVKDLVKLLCNGDLGEMEVGIIYDGEDRSDLNFILVGDDGRLRLCDYLAYVPVEYNVKSILCLPNTVVELCGNTYTCED